MTRHFPLGATIRDRGCDFAVWSRHASQIELCLFDEQGDREIARLPMKRGKDDIHHVFVEGAGAGSRYGFRAHGVHSPNHGLWHDPAKLLVDPYAREIDRPFVQSPRLAEFGADTADLVPRAIVSPEHDVKARPLPLDPAGLIYEVNVRALTMRHPAIPKKDRGTIRALAHPAMIAHYKRIGVSFVELMPVVAWIDERHLPPLGLSNGWGYNPVALMALEPRLAPGGMADLRQTVERLHENGIGVILDLVFNHTGESDRHGPTLSLRGLDNLGYYRSAPNEPGTLINDTGCGNTLAAEQPAVHRLIIDSLKHFVRAAGIDGFRFDLATILGRGPQGFSPDAPFFAAIADEPLLKHRIMIAEPWDIGLGGYQLGNFPERFLEWNDRARDDIRMFWRGDRNKIGALATALAGSSDIFGRHGAATTRTLNFIAAHDGFTLHDLVAHEKKHNMANGEHNRDGHNENHSWNNGVEGKSRQKAVLAHRKADVMALISTLFAMRGAIMLTAGDEMGRSQKGNNNAYAQDNDLTWLDWQGADGELIGHVADLAGIRRRFEVFSRREFFTGRGDVAWLNSEGEPMHVTDWQDPDCDLLTMMLSTRDRESGHLVDLAVVFNRCHRKSAARLPGKPDDWSNLLGEGLALPPRSVSFFLRPNRGQSGKRT